MMTTAAPLFLTDARGRRRAVQLSYRAWLELQRQMDELRLRDQLRSALGEVADMVAGRAGKTSLTSGLAQIQAELDAEARG